MTDLFQFYIHELQFDIIILLYMCIYYNNYSKREPLGLLYRV